MLIIHGLDITFCNVEVLERKGTTEMCPRGQSHGSSTMEDGEHWRSHGEGQPLAPFLLGSDVWDLCKTDRFFGGGAVGRLQQKRYMEVNIQTTRRPC